MFASLWKVLVRRWRHPGSLSEGDTSPPVAAQRPNWQRSQAPSARRSAPPERRVPGPKSPRSTAARPSPIARSAHAGRRIDRVHADPLEIARPQTAKALARRTPQRRYVWLEARQKAALATSPATVIPLHARTPRGALDGAIDAAA